ncbi:MAG: glutathione peroxidase [Bacteroidota bacterium]|jgi:glutathione peroxidase
MRQFILIILFANILSSMQAQKISSVHDFKVTSLDGETIDLSSFKGKKILIVNTASRCGYTRQYKDLEELHNKYKDKLVIIGFPANNFGGQEPGSNEEIREFCTKNYGVSFPMAAKVSVKGKDIHPLFDWLTHKTLNGVMDAEIRWNFGKFLIDENGKPVAYFGSGTNPMSDDIVSRLQ